MSKNYIVHIDMTYRIAPEPEKVALMCSVPGEAEPRIVECLLEYTPDAPPHKSGVKWSTGPNDSGMVLVNKRPTYRGVFKNGTKVADVNS